MKIKKILCLLLALVICFSLTGCNLIDMMREEQIFTNKAGNIVYDDHEYILLPECDVFMPILTDGGDDLYLTEENVPVLLTPFFGKAYALSDDKKFIKKDDYDEFYNVEGYVSKIYARDDVYEKYKDRIESGDYFDGYAYVHEYYDEEDVEYKTKHKFLSTKYSTAMDAVLATEPLTDIDTSLLFPYNVVSIYSSSKDFLFMEYAFTIYKTEKFIYLSTDGKDAAVYKVTEEYYKTFENFVEEFYNG